VDSHFNLILDSSGSMTSLGHVLDKLGIIFWLINGHDCIYFFFKESSNVKWSFL